MSRVHSCIYSVLLVLFLSLPNAVVSKCTKPPVIFNFGDSNSDTGGMVAGLGYPVDLPYGRTFFRRSTGRLSDGRLIIDFLCQSLRTNLLNPYMEALASNFRNGANFAVVGSATHPKFKPFSLDVQVMQWLHFKARSLELTASGSAGARGLINEEGFRNALYMIDIGQNDLADAFDNNWAYQERIPLVIGEIEQAVKTLYDQGARKFWIHNTGPLGCLPQKLSNVTKATDRDPAGCIASYNAAARAFNRALLDLCQKMKSAFAGATIIYVDIYSVKYDLIANATKYGFVNPLMACCGTGGPPYNYNVRMTCSHYGSQPCNDASRAISWDGVHYTEAANAIVARRILSTNYNAPKMSFDFFCN